ncbi:PH and SEC7 domain-containing protein 1-like isoform X3 [Xenia sp. Carnegie-2017]|nr:PH and SEC7 domain-containing protein 1-like isoform X3 [Xenia sp. Carnegie-2017]
MTKGRPRVVGEADSLTGIEKGTDGIFRRRSSERSGSFSKVLTSFPAHPGPPRTIENAKRTNVRFASRKLDIKRTTSEQNTLAPIGSSYSASLPEIDVHHVKQGKRSAQNQAWERCSSTGDGLRNEWSAYEMTSHIRRADHQSLTSSSKSSLPSSLNQNSKLFGEDSPITSLTRSPYSFRKFQYNSIDENEDVDLRNNDKIDDGQQMNNTDLNAQELARKLYEFDGFDRNEIAPMLFKNDEFTKNVALLYMKNFDFNNKDIVEALRLLLDRLNLFGETQERERILVAFSTCYHECNKPSYGSIDAVHALVCAIMLLNTDLHGQQTINRRMKQVDFVKNLSGMCDGNDYPANLLKSLYTSIKSHPLEFHREDIPNHTMESHKSNGKEVKDSNGGKFSGNSALTGFQSDEEDVIYRQGLLYRKLVVDSGGKKASAWKRNWQPFVATLRGMVMYLHKPDESRSFNDTRFAVGAHHAFASPAFDYKKKSFVLRFITADWKVLLFQARDKADMFAWVECLNLVAATFSSPPLPAAVGSHKRFQKPVLPFSKTQLTLAEQLSNHEAKSKDMADTLIDHLNNEPKGVDVRHRDIIEWQEKRDFYDYEYKRYRSYANILKSSKLQAQAPRKVTRKSSNPETFGKKNGFLNENLRRFNSLDNIVESPEGSETRKMSHRESYFMAIHPG